MELRNKQVIVVGLGKSGVAVARLCLGRGARVIGTDSAAIEYLSEEARTLPIERITGAWAGVPFGAADLVVVSPGVPHFSALDEAARAGVPVIGEVEFAYRLLDVPILAVGGTNGKSTVTLLASRIAKATGRNIFVGGNLGTPLSEAVGGEFDLAVVEVSSFQMERVVEFRPRVAALLNITDDHLDRYANFLAYAAAKGNCFAQQTEDDVAVVPYGDRICEREVRRGDARLVSFGTDRRADYVVDATGVVERDSGERWEVPRRELAGAHNRANAAAAIAMMRAVGASPAVVTAGLADFRPLPHRMAFVLEHGGVNWYDDSKATNVGAAVTALLGLSEERAVMILGGRDKRGDYAPLVAALKERGRAVVLLGEASDVIARALDGALPAARAESMADAVAWAARLAAPGDAVLLSPACSSFDLFKSYAERGNHFAEAVRRLAEGDDDGDEESD